MAFVDGVPSKFLNKFPTSDDMDTTYDVPEEYRNCFNVYDDIPMTDEQQPLDLGLLTLGLVYMLYI
ncbi:hypothetical protein BJ944DRAFT_253404 [Cunninghamella echinulata]|nr:hypothetical protein BJ944DRAFT_253404 [Cunninghamella echinulata]